MASEETAGATATTDAGRPPPTLARVTPRPASPTLRFLGAAGTVTGSRFLVEAAGSRVLVDCGLFQGLKPLRLRNWEDLPVDAASIDAVVLSHAHLDHSGYLPRLAKAGFRGEVLATVSTADLAGIVLPDSGHLQEEEADYANRKGFSKHRPARPLYTEAEARASLDRFRPVDFGEPVVVGDLTVTLRPAGHILGSATVTVDVPGGRRAVFSGDLGRPSHPLLVPPAPIGRTDIVVTESTYGDREHLVEGHDEAVEVLADIVRRTAERGGKVVIPAFAVDRTEVVLVHLKDLMEAGAIPRLPVFVDSPMALTALGVYRRAIAAGAPDIRPDLVGRPDPFDTGTLSEARTREQSMDIDASAYPSIVVSASGMASGGRVLHHLAATLGHQRNSVVLVGFQAAGTRGRSLAEGARAVKMFGRYVPVRAEVAVLDGLSVHADASEIVDWLRTADGEPDTVFCVHGEPNAAAALADRVDGELGWAAVVPRHGERVRLD